MKMHISISLKRPIYQLVLLAAACLLVPRLALSQSTQPQGKTVVQVDNLTMLVVGIPQRHEDKMDIGWVATIEARETSGKVVSKVNAAVTGCEPNQLGPKLGRMFILNGRTRYWSPSGDQVVDLLANAVCSARPMP